MKERSPYKLLTRVTLILAAMAISTYTLSGHLSKITQVTQGTTGNDAFGLLSGHAPEVRGGVNGAGGDPTSAAVEYAKSLAGGEKSNTKAKLVMFPGDNGMSDEQRKKLLADAERMRPEVPETPKRR